jgi:hypothetical protein
VAERRNLANVVEVLERSNAPLGGGSRHFEISSGPSLPQFMLQRNNRL